jgi:hypothetical protein
MSTLKEQVNDILHAKIARIARAEFAKVNPRPKLHKPTKPYTLPACVDVMVGMLGRIESATVAELEQFAHYATSGEVRELTQGRSPIHN